MESERQKIPVTPARVVGFSIPGSSPGASDVPKWTPKASSIERRKSQQSIELTPDATQGTGSAGKGSPWKVLPNVTTSIASINAEALPPTPIASKSTPTKSPESSAALLRPSGVAQSLGANSATKLPLRPAPNHTSSQTGVSGLGPVITPVRSASTSNVPITTTRKKGAGAEAWTRPPPPPSVTPIHGPAPSILEIQRQEREELEAAKTKKGLREIQEEEEERRAREDFERWWAMEEEKVRGEEEALLAAAKAMSAASTGGRMGGRPGRGPTKKKTKHSGGGRPAANRDGVVKSTEQTPAIPIGKPGASRSQGDRSRLQ